MLLFNFSLYFKISYLNLNIYMYIYIFNIINKKF